VSASWCFLHSAERGDNFAKDILGALAGPVSLRVVPLALLTVMSTQGTQSILFASSRA